MEAIRKKFFQRSDLHLEAIAAADRLVVQARSLRRDLEDIACNADPIEELTQRIHRCRSGDCVDRD